MRQQDFEALLADTKKSINEDIKWEEDKDHPPTVMFQVKVTGYPLYVKGSYKPITQGLSYVLIYYGVGRIYGLDMGHNHTNPSGFKVGRKHKHRWDENLRDQEAYVPDDITAPASDPLGVWRQFCKEALIIHNGRMYLPPPLRLELF